MGSGPLNHERRKFEYKEGRAVSSPFRISMRFFSYVGYTQYQYASKPGENMKGISRNLVNRNSAECI